MRLESRRFPKYDAAGVALCVGIESIAVMEDICGLLPAEAEEVKLWAAGALLQAALQVSEANANEHST